MVVSTAGGYECRWGMKKIAIFDQYVALSRVVNGATVRCCNQNAAGPWQVGDIAGSSKRRCLLIAGDRQPSAKHQWILLMSGSLDITLKTAGTREHLCRLGANEAPRTWCQRSRAWCLGRRCPQPTIKDLGTVMSSPSGIPVQRPVEKGIWHILCLSRGRW